MKVSILVLVIDVYDDDVNLWTKRIVGNAF